MLSLDFIYIFCQKIKISSYLSAERWRFCFVFSCSIFFYNKASFMNCLCTWVIYSYVDWRVGHRTSLLKNVGIVLWLALLALLLWGSLSYSPIFHYFLLNKDFISIFAFSVLLVLVQSQVHLRPQHRFFNTTASVCFIVFCCLFIISVMSCLKLVCLECTPFFLS